MNQALDFGDREVGWIGDTEEDLELGIHLRGLGADGFEEARVGAADGFEDGDRKVGSLESCATQMQQTCCEGEELISCRDKADENEDGHTTRPAVRRRRPRRTHRPSAGG